MFSPLENAVTRKQYERSYAHSSAGGSRLPKPRDRLAGQTAVAPYGWAVLTFLAMKSQRTNLNVMADRRVEVLGRRLTAGRRISSSVPGARTGLPFIPAKRRSGCFPQ